MLIQNKLLKDFSLDTVQLKAFEKRAFTSENQPFGLVDNRSHLFPSTKASYTFIEINSIYIWITL